ncbi:MAG: hypothetical protein JSV96_05275 [Candidatus Aminicenantes bacterium]|nr:MAG: hypothetical protein JSV96_05275 [Candidatus Aminicenantes bacterium]
MARSKSIRVTPNVKASLDILKKAVRSLPASDLKKNAQGAIKYLDQTFEGKPQPRMGIFCPPEIPIIM